MAAGAAVLSVCTQSASEFFGESVSICNASNQNGRRMGEQNRVQGCGPGEQSDDQASGDGRQTSGESARVRSSREVDGHVGQASSGRVFEQAVHKWFKCSEL